MSLDQFLNTRMRDEKRKYRTINVDQDLHYFLKQTSSHYNIHLSDLIHNILSDWKAEFQDHIRADMIENLDKKG